MSSDDLSYYRRREEIELARARQAIRPEVVAAHHQLASEYRKRVASVELTQPIVHA